MRLMYVDVCVLRGVISTYFSDFVAEWVPASFLYVFS